jgi:hypothetical protein
MEFIKDVSGRKTTRAKGRPSFHGAVIKMAGPKMSGDLKVGTKVRIYYGLAVPLGVDTKEIHLNDPSAR